MRPAPKVGQVWEHTNGIRREVLRVNEGSTRPQVLWERCNPLPFSRTFTGCSLATWDRWARNAALQTEGS